VAGIVRSMNKAGYAAKGISSNCTQEERETMMREFKNKQYPILVATDVLSRGIDIDSLSHVVNYDIPRAAEDYVHRIGRTARAATTGTAITFISDQDQDRVVKIEKLIEREVDKLKITEELGVGEAPEFDPKRFSGLHGKRGSSSGRDGNRSAGSSGSSRGPRREGDRPSGEHRNHDRRGPRRPEGSAPTPADGSAATSAPRPPRAPRPEGAAPAEGAATGEPQEGQRRRKRGGRNRNGRGPRPEGGATGEVTTSVAPSE